jgi:hypothetical protein
MTFFNFLKKRKKIYPLPIVPWLLQKDLRLWEAKQIKKMRDNATGDFLSATKNLMERLAGPVGFITTCHNHSLHVCWIADPAEEFRNIIETSYPGLIAVPRPGGVSGLLASLSFYTDALIFQGRSNFLSEENLEVESTLLSLPDLLLDELPGKNWLYVTLAFPIEKHESQGTMIKEWYNASVLFSHQDAGITAVDKHLLDYFSKKSTTGKNWIKITSCSSRIEHASIKGLTDLPFTQMDSSWLSLLLSPPTVSQRGYRVFPAEQEVVCFDPDLITDRKVLLGIEANKEEPVYFDAGRIASHLLLAGSSAEDIYPTALVLLYQLWRNNNIPFLVIEPSGTTVFTELLRAYFGEDITVYSTAPDSEETLQLDMFSYFPDSGYSFSEHIDRLLRIFQIVYPQTASVALPLKRALARWLNPDTSEKGFLRFATLVKTVQKLIAEECDSYDRTTRDFLESLLLETIKNFSAGSLERFICTENELPDTWDRIFLKPVVLQVNPSGDTRESALASLLFLNRLVLQARKSSSYDSMRLHLTVIDRLHDFLQTSTPGSIDDARLAQFVRDLLSPSCAGEAFAFVETLPAEISEEILDHTGQQILHHMELEDLHGFTAKTQFDKITRGMLANLEKKQALWLASGGARYLLRTGETINTTI